jgi:serine protease Do
MFPTWHDERTSRGRWLRPARASGLAAVLAGSLLVTGLSAEEPGGLAAVAAIEQALSAAIAQAEQSVVAIARVRQTDRDSALRLAPQFDPFGQAVRFPNQPRPGEAGFIPHEYATGVVIDRDGLVLTNYHVLGEESDYFVTTPDRKTYQAQIKAADPRSDLAVLQIPARNLPAIKLGDGGAVKKGQLVVVLGNPHAIARDGQASASWGIVSNLSRKAAPSVDTEAPRGRNTLHQFGTLIQTDARLNLGTSGGALINLQGEMIGLTTSLAAVNGYEQAAGYAIPIDDAFRRVINTLKQGKEVEYGFLGITPADLPPSQVLAGKQGGVVVQVLEGTPAARAGLRRDDLITHVNGQAVFDSDSLMLQLGRLPADASAQLTVERQDGQVESRKVLLAKYRVFGKKIVTTGPPAWRGMQVDYWTAHFDLQQNRFFESDLDGVAVTSVAEDSPAWKGGLRADMLITHVGPARVSTPKEFHAALAGHSGPVALQVRSVSGPSSERITRVVHPGP